MSAKRKGFSSSPATQRSIVSFFTHAAKAPRGDGFGASQEGQGEGEPSPALKKSRRCEPGDGVLSPQTPTSNARLGCCPSNDSDASDEPVVPRSLDFRSEDCDFTTQGDAPGKSNRKPLLPTPALENAGSPKPIRPPVPDREEGDDVEDMDISIKRRRGARSSKRRILSLEDSEEEEGVGMEAMTPTRTEQVLAPKHRYSPRGKETDLKSLDSLKLQDLTSLSFERESAPKVANEKDTFKHSADLNPPSGSSSKGTIAGVSNSAACGNGERARSMFAKNADFSNDVETAQANSSDLLANDYGIQLSGIAAERFGNRLSEKFPFLNGSRRDARGRKMDDKDFDKSTLLLPEKFLKSLSEGQRQWWEFKANNMDKILFFKMGKFYEMYEMDAHIGVQELDLQYMKGDQPHCGFPEKSYAIYASKLALKGYRVLVIEQTETPDQLEQRRRETGCKDKVVRREICSLITKGTIVDEDMMNENYEFSYILSIYEHIPSNLELKKFQLEGLDEDGILCEEGISEFDSNDGDSSQNHFVMLGVCLVDVSSSTVFLDQFVDDPSRKKLKNILSEYRPVEIIKAGNFLSKQTEKTIRDNTKNPLITSVVLDAHQLNPGNILSHIFSYFDHAIQQRTKQKINATDGSRKKLVPSAESHDVHSSDDEEMDYVLDSEKKWTHLLNFLQSLDVLGKSCLCSLKVILSYLKNAFLDERFLLSAKTKFLPTSYMYGILKKNSRENSRNETTAERHMDEFPDQGLDTAMDQQTKPGFDFEDLYAFEEYMHLDSSTIENLEILENTKDGGTEGTLFSLLDYCVTNFGKRKLKHWIVHPLLNVESIRRRQSAISDLRGIGRTGLNESRKILSTCPDLEKLLTRLQSNTSRLKNAILYEDFTLKKVKEFVSGLRAIVILKKAVECFDSIKPDFCQFLRNLLTPGVGFPHFFSEIKYFENAFDWSEAERTGRIIPIKGKNKKYDRVNQSVLSIENELEKYLQKQQRIFGNSDEVNYVTVGKDQYLLEIPDHFHSRVPSNYEVRSQKKGFYRYWTEDIKEMLSRLSDAIEQKESFLTNIFENLRNEFCSRMRIWNKLVETIAELDALSSLAIAGDCSDTPTCQPEVSPLCKSDSPFLLSRNLKHPILVKHDPLHSFVPNDVNLGGGQHNFAILTGPNMGGKSTLLRQICLAVIMAQIGANVHADEFRLSVIDKIFVRMGAKDNIISNQSTFFTELSETSTMLKLATKNSLVLLDELGRGTSTADGQAIAHAVLEHLAHEKQCLGIFSTHYHKLAEEFDSDPMVFNYHMACKVDKDSNGSENVFFLYKLLEGICPKSYGLNVARIAGVPRSVLETAEKKAAELERLKNAELIKSKQKSHAGTRNVVPALGIREESALKQIFQAFQASSNLWMDHLASPQVTDDDSMMNDPSLVESVAKLHSNLLECWKDFNDTSL